MSAREREFGATFATYKVVRALAAAVRSESLQGALVLIVCLAVFFSTPLAQYRKVDYSSADLTQALSLTRIEPGHAPGNQLQSDAVTQMQPWLMFNREELAAGRVPLWNPWNGAGCPHFANYQSAVFSPFSLPFYVLSMKAALLISAAMKLFALGFFTFLFLKEIGLRQIPALIGGIAFMFAGHNSLLVYFPHVGAMVALPAGLFFAEMVLHRFERAREAGERAHLAWPLLGFTLTLFVGLLSGNPEPFYFACILIAAYVFARLLRSWLVARGDRQGRREIAKLGGKLVFAALIAAGLAAFQILPFFEYLQNSRVIEQRSLRQTPLESTYWPLMMFPDALGNPGSPYKISDIVPPPNYELVNMAYVGGLAMLLAIVAAFFARRDRFAAFFALAGAVWLLYAYDLFGASDWFMKLPTLDRAPMNRSQGVWNFIVACSAALCVDRLARREGRREWVKAAGIVVFGAAGLIACLIGADRLIDRFATFESPNHELFLRYVPPHIAWMGQLFALGTAAAALLLLARWNFTRTLLSLVIGACVFMQGGHLLKDYNPVTENRFFFPKTEAIQALQAHVGKDRLAILGEDMIPPDSNIAYHLKLAQNYDGMCVRDYDFLYRDHFGDTNNWRPMLKCTRRSLKTFSIRWLLAKWGWNACDNGLREFGKGGGQQPIRREILPNRPVTQTFIGRETGLDTVMVVLSTYSKGNECTLQFKLEDLDAGQVISEQTMKCSEIQASVYSKKHVIWPSEYKLNPRGRPVVFHVPQQKESTGKHYKITLTTPDGGGDDTIVAWSMPLNGYGEGEAYYGKKLLPGELLFDWAYRSEEFEQVAAFEDYVLYRFKDAMPKYEVVGDAVIAQSDQEALELLRSPSFDAKTLVVLRPDEAVTASTAISVREKAQRRLLQFSDSKYCYLLAPDGRSLVHIDDEATFLTNNFKWGQIERVPASERAKYVFIDDADREAKERAGVRLVKPAPLFAVPIQVLDETPTRIRLRLQRQLPGWLVIKQTFFPGWKAWLNGERVPIHRADYAFDAIEIPMGDLILDLAYEPDSLRLGIWIGVTSVMMGIGAMILGLRAARVLAAPISAVSA